MEKSKIQPQKPNIKLLFAIKDVKTEYSSLMEFVNEQDCLRKIRLWVNDTSQQNIFNTFVEDKELWFMGFYNPLDGIIHQEKPIFIDKFTNFLPKKIKEHNV